MTHTCTKVTVRQREIRNNRISLYLDYYPAVRNPETMQMSRREYLGIYIYAHPKNEMEREFNTTYVEFKTVRDDLHRLWKVKSCVDTAARFNERTEEQMLQNRPQTRHKKEDMTR